MDSVVDWRWYTLLRNILVVIRFLRQKIPIFVFNGINFNVIFN